MKTLNMKAHKLMYVFALMICRLLTYCTTGIDSSAQGIDITDSEVTVAKGTTYQFTALSSGSDVTSSASWSLEGEGCGTSAISSGLFTAPPAEEAIALNPDCTVRAERGSNYDTAIAMIGVGTDLSSKDEKYLSITGATWEISDLKVLSGSAPTIFLCMAVWEGFDVWFEDDDVNIDFDSTAVGCTVSVDGLETAQEPVFMDSSGPHGWPLFPRFAPIQKADGSGWTLHVGYFLDQPNEQNEHNNEVRYSLVSIGPDYTITAGEPVDLTSNPYREETIWDVQSDSQDNAYIVWNERNESYTCEAANNAIWIARIDPAGNVEKFKVADAFERDHGGNSTRLAVGPDDTLYSLYVEGNTQVGGRCGPENRLWITKSTDRGESFTDATMLWSGGSVREGVWIRDNITSLDLALGPDGVIHIVFSKVDNDNVADIMYVNGSSFSFGSPETIAAHVATNGDYRGGPYIEVDEMGNMNVFYFEETQIAPDQYEVDLYLLRSTEKDHDGNPVWQDPEKISNNPGKSPFIDDPPIHTMAMDHDSSGRLWVCWSTDSVTQYYPVMTCTVMD